MLIKQVVGLTPKRLTVGKFYGKYYHAITRHAVESYRIMSGATMYAEKEKCTFFGIKSKAKSTTNHHGQNVIDNAFIRMQVSLKDRKISTRRVESEISAYSKLLKEKACNTVITFDVLETHDFQYQAMLEKVADFLIEEKVYWDETNEGIVFFDVHPSGKKSKKTLHHFRAFSVKDEETYVKHCWNQCLEEADHLIPAKVIKDDNDGHKIYLNTLSKFRKENHMEDTSVDLTCIPKAPLPKLSVTPITNSVLSLDIESPKVPNESQMNISIQCTPTKSNNCAFCSSTPLPEKVVPSKEVKPNNDDDDEHENDATMRIKCAHSEPGPSTSTTCNYSKSSKMLNELFGEIDEIKEFDIIRKDMKQCLKQGIRVGDKSDKRYSQLVKQFVVRLKELQGKLKVNFKSMEMNALKENASLCFKPSESSPDYKEYVKVTKHLKYISALLTEFQT